MVTQGGDAPDGRSTVRIGALIMMARSLITTMEGTLEQLQSELARFGQDGTPTDTRLDALREENEQLRGAIAARGVIEQAKGIVMAEARCDPEAAFCLLVDRSRSERRKVRDIAQDIVSAAALHEAEGSVARIYPKRGDVAQ
ncbi:ANTAR domain-containing response regulator [Streptacidiphilus sp. N1-12]|uniref:ANTAR domain-containing response regulator n=2 Tax=Streptacidiphilus alkalitolerans TaxID=3342712 RepID=A0ABV6X0C5_9ACTN